MAKRRSIGDYLADLENSQNPQLITLTQIQLPSSQPRRYFDPVKLELLMESIRQHGILQPLLIRTKDMAYELVAGERRYRAAQLLNLIEVPASIRDLNDQEAATLSLIENLHREDLNPVEETEGILALLESQLESDQPITSLLYSMLNDKQRLTNNVVSQDWNTVESVFKELSLNWESFTKHRLPLLKLPEDVLQMLRQGKIEYTKARAIARIKDPTQRQQILDQTLAQSLSLSQIRELIATLKPDQSSPKRLEDTYKKLKKSRFWENPQKRAEIEILLDKLEGLINEVH